MSVSFNRRLFGSLITGLYAPLFAYAGDAEHTPFGVYPAPDNSGNNTNIQRTAYDVREEPENVRPRVEGNGVHLYSAGGFAGYTFSEDQGIELINSDAILQGVEVGIETFDEWHIFAMRLGPQTIEQNEAQELGVMYCELEYSTNEGVFHQGVGGFDYQGANGREIGVYHHPFNQTVPHSLPYLRRGRTLNVGGDIALERIFVFAINPQQRIVRLAHAVGRDDMWTRTQGARQTWETPAMPASAVPSPLRPKFYTGSQRFLKRAAYGISVYEPSAAEMRSTIEAFKRPVRLEGESEPVIDWSTYNGEED